METSIADLKANKQRPVQPNEPNLQPAPVIQQPQSQPQPQQMMNTMQMAPQPQQLMNSAPIQAFQTPAYNLQQNNSYPMDMSLHYSKFKDIGILLLISMICFSTPFQDIVAKNIPTFSSTNTGKHTNMMGCLFISSILTSLFGIYKTFGNE